MRDVCRRCDGAVLASGVGNGVVSLNFEVPMAVQAGGKFVCGGANRTKNSKVLHFGIFVRKLGPSVAPGAQRPGRKSSDREGITMNQLRQAILQALLLSGCVLVGPGLALAQSPNAPQQPQSSAGTGKQTAAKKTDAKGEKIHELQAIVVVGNTVNKLAPSAPPLEAAQPTSIIDERFIRDSLRMDSTYDDIIKYSPSVTVTSPEGPGLGKNEGTSIRGFQDGQFNVTFDGIPFGNPADLHHSTSAYFSNHVLKQVQIDRGPGGGSTIGNATFGGTVALRTRTPDAVSGFTPYLTLGSWGYHAEGLAVDEKLGERTGLFADFSTQKGETFLKGTDDNRQHAFVKLVNRIGQTPG